MDNLPKGWANTRIGDICDLINGRTFKSSEWNNSGIPIIRIQNLNDELAPFNYCSFEVEKKYHVHAGDFLFAWSGTPGTSFGAHIWKGQRAFLNQHIFKININEKYIDKVFFKHLLNNRIGEYVKKAHGTAGLAHITKNKFESSAIQIPPINEQKRIVAKIEELFSELDEGIVALKKAQFELRRYRQAVLKAAFEGKFTEKWRIANKEKIESQENISKRIVLEAAKNKPKKNQEYSNGYLNLLDLPAEWCWAKIGDIIEKSQYGTSDKAGDDQTGIIVIRMGNIFEGKIVFDKLKYFPLNWQNTKEFLLEDGDILFNRTNSFELVGKSAVYKKNYPSAVFASYLIKLKPKNGYSSDLISYYINSLFGRKYVVSVVTQQVGQANVNGTKLSNMPIPIMSQSEQNMIQAEIEKRFSTADSTQQIIEKTILESDRLRQSILKKAFEGKLVSQDPSDEPAEILLEKIKHEKVKLQLEEKSKKKKR